MLQPSETAARVPHEVKDELVGRQVSLQSFGMREQRIVPVVVAITPYCTVDDAAGFIEFLGTVFGGEMMSRRDRPDGRIDHAKVTIGSSLVMVNDSSDDYPPHPAQLHVRVADADLTFAAAIAAGAVEVMAPNARDYGDRLAGIRDPFGNTWWIASAPPNTRRERVSPVIQ